MFPGPRAELFARERAPGWDAWGNEVGRLGSRHLEQDILLRAISLGAGVQSSTLALMAARRDIGPMPDLAIFADTGWEPAGVYEWLDRLESMLPFPVVRVRRPGPDLGQHAINIAHKPVTRTASPPWYTKGPDGMLPKQCSKEFKIRAIQKEVRRQLGLAPGQRGPRSIAVEQWIGISTDEAHRMKPSELRDIGNRWPLIEVGMSRRACLKWMEERQYPRPPKSSCVFCPYRGNEQWRDMRDNAPDDWAKAVEFDCAIRPGFHGMEGGAYLHRQRVPLSDVDLSTWADRGQSDLFGEECSGVCNT